MPVATARCVGEDMAQKTVGEILRPTKGADSYPRIAIKANNWLREQIETGRPLSVSRMSSEQVRRIFEDITAKPDMIYLEALAAVQRVDVTVLYEAAGYSVPVAPSNGLSQQERFIIHAYRSASTPEERKKLEDIAREICDEEDEELRNDTDQGP